MGLFDRLRGRDADSTPDHAAASADDVTADDSGVEALEEIGIRAKEDWHAAGGEELVLVPSLNATAPWVDAVVSMVREYAGPTT